MWGRWHSSGRAKRCHCRRLSCSECEAKSAGLGVAVNISRAKVAKTPKTERRNTENTGRVALKEKSSVAERGEIKRKGAGFR